MSAQAGVLAVYVRVENMGSTRCCACCWLCLLMHVACAVQLDVHLHPSFAACEDKICPNPLYWKICCGCDGMGCALLPAHLPVTWLTLEHCCCTALLAISLQLCRVWFTCLHVSICQHAANQLETKQGLSFCSSCQPKLAGDPCQHHYHCQDPVTLPHSRLHHQQPPAVRQVLLSAACTAASRQPGQQPSPRAPRPAHPAAQQQQRNVTPEQHTQPEAGADATLRQTPVGTDSNSTQ